MKISPPRVSVVVPTFNSGPYVEETIRSILAQTYTDFELIVADHSSTDDTVARIERFRTDPRVKLMHTEAGGGAKRNWDRASQAAAGDLIKLVCGDDLVAPTIIAEQVAAFDKHPTAVLVAAQRALVDAKGRPFIRARGLAGLSGLVDGREVVRHCVRAGANIFGEPACVMIRRADLEAVGWWHDEHPFLIDQATYAAVLFRGDFVGIARPLASFRISASQWSVRLATDQAAQAAGFHGSVRTAHPDLLSVPDIWMGNTKALATSFLRRGVYLMLRRRIS